MLRTVLDIFSDIDAANVLKQARTRHALDQRSLARRAGTTQAQVSRIERGVSSPSVATLQRLMEAMGEGLELRTTAGPRGNRSPAELRADFRDLTPGERVVQTAELSRALTAIASGRPRLR